MEIDLKVVGVIESLGPNTLIQCEYQEKTLWKDIIDSNQKLKSKNPIKGHRDNQINHLAVKTNLKDNEVDLINKYIDGKVWIKINTNNIEDITAKISEMITIVATEYVIFEK